MPRPRKRENQGLPTGLLCRKRQRKDGSITIYYYYALANGKEKALGKNKHLAILETAKLNYTEQQHIARPLFIDVAKRYEMEVVPLKKAQNTRNSNKQALRHLVRFFGDPPIALEDIQPQHVKQYLEWRKDTPAVANIEVNLLNHIWNTAREWGYTNLISPCTGVKKFKTQYRDIYVEDYLLEKLYACADQTLQDVMDVAYLLGQRPIDVVNIHRSHIYNGILHITQQKTGKKVRIEVSGKLAEILERRLTDQSQWLFTNHRNGKLTRPSLTNQFKALRQRTMQAYPELAEELSQVQLRDLRAKAATDISLNADRETARKQLGHSSQTMTQHYIRKEAVLKPTPTSLPHPHPNQNQSQTPEKPKK